MKTMRTSRAKQRKERTPPPASRARSVLDHAGARPHLRRSPRTDASTENTSTRVVPHLWSSTTSESVPQLQTQAPDESKPPGHAEEGLGVVRAFLASLQPRLDYKLFELQAAGVVTGKGLDHLGNYSSKGLHDWTKVHTRLTALDTTIIYSGLRKRRLMAARKVKS